MVGLGLGELLMVVEGGAEGGGGLTWIEGVALLSWGMDFHIESI